MNTTSTIVKQYVGLIKRTSVKRNNCILLAKIVDKIYEDLESYNNTPFGDNIMMAVTKSVQDFIQNENRYYPKKYAAIVESKVCSSELPIAFFSIDLTDTENQILTTLNLKLYSVALGRYGDVFNLTETKYLSNVFPLLAKERMDLTKEIERLREELETLTNLEF